MIISTNWIDCVRACVCVCVCVCVRVCVCACVTFDICIHRTLLFENLLRHRYNQSFSGHFAKITVMSQNYRSYHYKNSTKRKQIDLRNNHYNRMFLLYPLVVI